MSDEAPELCEKCGQFVVTQPDGVSIKGMFDCHLFCPFSGSTVDEVIAQWREQNSKPYPAIVGGQEVSDLGFAYLCPAIVLLNGKDVRRVGEMVMQDYKTKQPCEDEVRAYRQALLNDPDIPRLLAAGESDHE